MQAPVKAYRLSLEGPLFQGKEGVLGVRDGWGGAKEEENQVDGDGTVLTYTGHWSDFV
jgi:hypothetical protein